ncbi:MAG: bifunctional riboflavin kinase/FAD synthetase [Acidimicrobiales bacterium]
MEVIRIDAVDQPVPPPGAVAAGSAVTIGAYDGVHLGHRALIATTRDEAGRLGCASAVVTFDRHPASVVRPASAPRILTDLEQKLELLAATGVEVAVVVHFDEERAAEDPEHFVREVLVGLLRARAVVVGEDFHFGRHRGGNVAMLRGLGDELGFEVGGFGLLAEGGEPVSSTRIRALIAAGDVEGAAELLGRPHQVRGVVEHGDARGRDLGFPTANVSVPATIAVPADGVYAGWFAGEGEGRRGACVSVGRRPTFYSEDRSLVEAYVLDFAGDLYGSPARVDFVARQRGQERFDSVDALVAHMSADVEETRRRLLAAGPAG